MSGFKLGDLIYRSKPYVYVLNNDFRGQRCDNCFKKRDELKRCSQCSFVYFCNRNCQVKSWKTHKMECKYIKNAHPDLSPSLRLLAIVILKLKAFGSEEPSETIYGHKMNFHRLMSHAAEIKQNDKACEQMMSHLGALIDYIGDSNIPPPSDFFEIFGKVSVNTFNICDETLNIGSGIYLGASIFDHSCEPDAEVVFSGIEICIRAVKNIPHRDVKQIFISYIDPVELNQGRQDCLREQYYFSCKCSRCTSSYYDDLMTKTLTNKSASEVIETSSKKEIDRIKQMKEDRVGAIAIYEACQKELERQNGILATTHILRIKLLEFALDACIESKQWADAIRIGEELTDPYKLIYGTYHPMLGLHYFKIGKIQLFQGPLESAKINLLKADESLKVTHGSDHPLYENVLKALHECSIFQTSPVLYQAAKLVCLNV